jgi:anti-anti-sigma factor
MTNNAPPVDLRLLRPEAGFVRLELVGRLSRDGWPAGYDPFCELCGRDVYCGKLLLNLSKSNYLDSSGVAWLLAANKRFHESGGVLVLHSATPMTTQFFKMMRMDLVLALAVDETAARHRAETGAPAQENCIAASAGEKVDGAAHA